jgi:hypothetical protein
MVLLELLRKTKQICSQIVDPFLHKPIMNMMAMPGPSISYLLVITEGQKRKPSSRAFRYIKAGTVPS